MNIGYQNSRPSGWAILLVIFMLGLVACLSEISLEVPQTNSSNIAIRGKLVYGDTSLISIKITKVSDFTASDIPEAIIGATVELLTENEQRIGIPIREAGRYEREISANDPDFSLQLGMSYRLSVITSEGKQYLSEAEPLLAVPDARSIRHDTIRREILNEVGSLVEQEYLRFLMTTPLIISENSERALLKWNFLGTYRFTESNITTPYPNTRICYFTDVLDLEQVVVFNGLRSEQDHLTDFVLLEEPLDYRFTDGFYLTAVQESLSKGAYNYWEATSRVINLNGNFFEAPPGKIKGNFHNVDAPEEEVFGYFYLTQQDTLRLFVPAGARPVRQFCPLEANPGDENVPPVCFNCNARKESSLEKPTFWKE